MAFRSQRNRSIIPTHINPIGGVRLDLPPQAISEQELTGAFNMLYLPNSSVLSTRPALTCASIGAGLGHKILNMVAYKDKIACSADDSKIYMFDPATGGFSLHAGIKAGSVAVFADYNDKLLWADGESLYSWDGSTIKDLTPALHPSTVVEIASRVVINDTADHDAVYLSGPEDETDWDTSAGKAIGLRAGYGDAMAVNALAVLGQDVIVSKTGGNRHFTYRINTAGMPQQWQVMQLASDTSADGPLLFAGLPNDIMYINEAAELRSLSGISEYGDLRVANAGEKINTQLHDFALGDFKPSKLVFLTSYDMMACCCSGMIALFFVANQRFTFIDMTEAGVNLFCCCDFDNQPFWAGDTGHIYKFSEAGRIDQPAPGVTKPYSSRMRTKRFFVPGDVIVKRTDLSITAIASGEAVIEVLDVDSSVTVIKQFELHASVQLLHDATGLLYDAINDLAEGETEGEIVTSFNKVRAHNFYLQVRTLSGRIGINSLDTQMALVN